MKHPEDARSDVDTDLNDESSADPDGDGADTARDEGVENDSPAVEVEQEPTEGLSIAKDSTEGSARSDSDSEDIADDPADADADHQDNTLGSEADNTDTDTITVIGTDDDSTDMDSSDDEGVSGSESGDDASWEPSDDSSDDDFETGPAGANTEEGADRSDADGGSVGENTDSPDSAEIDGVQANVSRETPDTDGAGADSGSDAAVEVHHEPVSAAVFDDSTPLARELADITRRRQALAAQPLPLPAEPRIFTVANQKGGVGKTTTTVNLAAALARGGANVLVIDLDPQGNASTALGVEHRADTVSVYDVIINDQLMADVVQKSPEFDGLFCVPATIHLAGAEIELVSLVAREQRLRTALDRFLEESERDFHYVIIDCPPSLGLLTINAFVAAREVLIPIQCEYYALEGLSQLLSNIQLIERHLNPQLKVSTILLTMYDSRTNLANQVADEVRGHFPDQVLRTLIPRSVRIAEAPGYGQSVISYDPSSPGSLSYLEAAAEIARRGASS